MTDEHKLTDAQRRAKREYYAEEARRARDIEIPAPRDVAPGDGLSAADQLREIKLELREMESAISVIRQAAEELATQHRELTWRLAGLD